MKLQAAIEDFIVSRELDNCTAKTIRVYRDRLRYFSDWLHSAHNIDEVEDIQLSHLRGWISHLQKTPSPFGKKHSDESIHSYGQSLLAFCHWLESEEIILKPITPRFKLPRVEQKFIATFTPQEVDMLFAACEEGDPLKPDLRKALTSRNHAILSVLIDAGLRCSELIGLRLGDIDRDLRVLLVHRKGNKWQQVPMSREGFKALHEYLTKHRPYLLKQDGKTNSQKDDPVFLADDGKPLTVHGISMLFRRLKKRTGIEGKRVSPHNCRRYMATMQLAHGRSPLDVQRQMGHTTLVMTNRYASLTVKHLQKSHEQHSPLRMKELDERSGRGYYDE